MTALRLSRRGLFGGFAALLAAPAIVRVASIMPVKAMPPDAWGADAWYRHHVLRPGFRPVTVAELNTEVAKWAEALNHEALRLGYVVTTS